MAQVFGSESPLEPTKIRNNCEFGIGRGNLATKNETLPGEIRFQNPRATDSNVTNRK